MQDDEVMTFEEWQESAFCGGLGGGKSIAKLAWHARDAEVAALTSERDQFEKLYEDAFARLEAVEAAHREHERLAVAEALRRAAMRRCEWCARGLELVGNYHKACGEIGQHICDATDILALIPAADSRLLDERIAAERLAEAEWWHKMDSLRHVEHTQRCICLLCERVAERRTAAQPKQRRETE